MEATKLNSIAENNTTAIEIFDVLSKRQRVRKILDLRRFEYDLVQDGRKVDHDDLMKTFKLLQEAGAGAIVRKTDQPIRFVWNKNLKKVATEALSNVNLSKREYVSPTVTFKKTLTPEVKLTAKKPGRKPGRPAGSKNKRKVLAVSKQEFNINEATIQRIADLVISHLSDRIFGKAA